MVTKRKLNQNWCKLWKYRKGLPNVPKKTKCLHSKMGTVRSSRDPDVLPSIWMWTLGTIYLNHLIRLTLVTFLTIVWVQQISHLNKTTGGHHSLDNRSGENERNIWAYHKNKCDQAALKVPQYLSFHIKTIICFTKIPQLTP